MSQKHVDLLMEAVALNTDDRFLCNRIGYITGYHLTSLRNRKYNSDDYHKLKKVIQENINSNLDGSWWNAEEGAVFESTTFYQQGMTREQWAKEILAPLALELEED
jgi:hypothetical protein